MGEVIRMGPPVSPPCHALAVLFVLGVLVALVYLVELFVLHVVVYAHLCYDHHRDCTVVLVDVAYQNCTDVSDVCQGIIHLLRSEIVNLVADERSVRRPRDHVTKDKQKHSKAVTHHTIVIRKGYPEATTLVALCMYLDSDINNDNGGHTKPSSSS
jgi:hypothetical protein